MPARRPRDLVRLAGFTSVQRYIRQDQVRTSNRSHGIMSRLHKAQDRIYGARDMKACKEHGASVGARDGSYGSWSRRRSSLPLVSSRPSD